MLFRSGFGVSTTRVLRDDMSALNEVLLDSFIADLKKVQGELYLIFDDFHRVRHADLGPLVKYFFQQLPANVRVIGSTRHKPKAPEQAPLSGSWFTWIQADELRLSRAETQAYFSDLKQIELSSSELDLLYRRTEGWVTALHLVALALARHPDRSSFLKRLSGTERNIADYLAEDVLSHLPAEQQQFLEQTSVLDEFNAELCNALTDRKSVV